MIPGKEPPWLTAAVDQRLALMMDKIDYALLEGKTIILTTLTEPEEDTDVGLEYWEESCDNCRRWCPTSIHAGTKSVMHDGIQVVITFGVCPDCKEGFW